MFASPQQHVAAADTSSASAYGAHYANSQQQQQQSAAEHQPSTAYGRYLQEQGHQVPQQQQQQRRTSTPTPTTKTRPLSPEVLHPAAAADARMQTTFQRDLAASKPLFTAREIATRHLQSSFQVHAAGSDKPELYTNRMVTMSPRGKSAGASASPVVIDYQDDTEHGKKTRRRLQLDRKAGFADEAKDYVEKHGISILKQMQKQEACADRSLPGIQNRKCRTADPFSSKTHIKGCGFVEEVADASKFKFTRKVHADQAHATNLTRTMLPMRKIKTPSVQCLGRPPSPPRGIRRGPRHSIDTNRVLTPEMIPPAREPRLRSLQPKESLGQGMSIKEGADEWEWKGGLQSRSYWKNTDPFAGEP